MDFMFRLNPKSAAEMINRQMASLLKKWLKNEDGIGESIPIPSMF